MDILCSTNTLTNRETADYGQKKGQETYLRARDGRQIALFLKGPAGGVPIFSYHGNPGGRFTVHPSYEELEDLNVRIIAPDREGFGCSDRHRKLSVADTANDFEDTLSVLGIEKAGILARSGSVPFALGCAALKPHLVSSMVLMCGISPPESGVSTASNTTPENQYAYYRAQQDPEALAWLIEKYATDLHFRADSLMKQIEPHFKKADWAALKDGAYDEVCLGQHYGVVGCGLNRPFGSGWLDSVLALRKSWGFDVSCIQTPTRLWHGREDPFTDPAHSRWLAENIPGSEYFEDPDGSHFSSLLLTTEALRHIHDVTAAR
jgi:pimeloyl-ACP methyl ester carboxylesterase